MGVDPDYDETAVAREIADEVEREIEHVMDLSYYGLTNEALFEIFPALD